MLRLSLIASLLLIPMDVPGQENTNLGHLKKSNSNEFWFSVYRTDNCPGTKEAYEGIVKGEMLRARINQHRPGAMKILSCSLMYIVPRMAETCMQHIVYLCPLAYFEK